MGEPKAFNRLTRIYGFFVGGRMQASEEQEYGPREACGVVGIHSEGGGAAYLAYFALQALQHRGQESTGIGVSDGIRVVKQVGMGLVTDVFDDARLRELSGYLACGHNRYSTTGSSSLENCQPVSAADSNGRAVMVAHNGNIVNTQVLRHRLVAQGHRFQTTTDSEVIAALIAQHPVERIEETLSAILPHLAGSYAMVILTTKQIIGGRDPIGNRPLIIGRRDGDWLIASESCALDAVEAEVHREVEPGEFVVIEGAELRSYRFSHLDSDGFCLFEFIYLARPDSILRGRVVQDARYQLGRSLARQHPAEADLVVGVPMTALPAARGFADESGIPNSDGIVSNRYANRTFIQPTPELRRLGARLKYNAVPDVFAGKRVVVVDDSLIRGTTPTRIIELLRKAGAKEIHWRVASPAVQHVCMLGVDLARPEELIANRVGTLLALRDTLGLASLECLDIAQVRQSLGIAKGCAGCFTGEYPMNEF